MNTRKVILLCWVGLLLSTAAHARIVFSSTRDGVKGIYVMDDDGSNQTLIRQANEWNPKVPFPYCWSTDGKQILIQTYGLSLMNADGTNVRKLIRNDFGGSIGRGSFSPDGLFIVFKRSFLKNDALKYGIYVLNIRTLKMEAIASQVMLSQCDWSPDGKYIICSEWVTFGANTTIWIMDADGHNRRPLIPKPVGGEFSIHRSGPRWSPDGQQIVFRQQEWIDGSFYKAFRYIICDRNGENIKQLHIPKDMQGISVGWMDDGESIVFSARAPIPLNRKLPKDFDFPNANIYKYHIGTSKMTRLTNHPGMNQSLDLCKCP